MPRKRSAWKAIRLGSNKVYKKQGWTHIIIVIISNLKIKTTLLDKMQKKEPSVNLAP